MNLVPPPAEQKWVAVLIFGLLLSSLVLGWMLRSSVCVESAWLNSIEFDQGKEVPACRSKRSSNFDVWINDHLNSLNTRIRRVEQVLSALNLQPRALGTISLIEAQFDGTWNLERQILSRALWNGNPGIEQNLFINLILETYIVGQPIAGVGASLDQQMWQEILRQSFEDKNLHQRFEFLSEWLGRIRNHLPGLTTDVSWSAHEDAQKKAQFIGYDVKGRHWNLPTLALTDRVLSPEAEKNLRRHRITSLSQNGLQFPFSPDHFSLGEAAPIRASKLLLVRCHFPDLHELEFLGLEFEHVILVQNCNEVSSDFMISALGNSQDFASRYPESQFVHIHWPSLRLVLAKSGVKTRSIAGLFEDNSIASFRRVGLLKELEKDHDTGLGHWNGALEPVLFYRMNTKN